MFGYGDYVCFAHANLNVVQAADAIVDGFALIAWSACEPTSLEIRLQLVLNTKVGLQYALFHQMRDSIKKKFIKYVNVVKW